MNIRNSIAVVVGIIIGCIAGYTVGNGGYGAFAVLAFWGVVSPLIVYRIAERRAIWVSIVPGITLVLVGAVMERLRYPYRPFQALAVILGAVLMALFTLLISAPAYWIRSYLSKRASKNKTVNDL